MSRPMFSLIVPVYNVESYLGECLDSIVAQTNRDFELILVDDGSTDSSGKLADAFQKKNADAFPIQVVHQTNQGLSAARNCGISHASGEYILCIDSDDYIIPETLQALQEKLQEASYDMVFFRFQEFDENGQRDIRPVLFPSAMSMRNAETLEALFTKHLENFAWSFLAKRELYSDIHFPIGRNYEDKATTYRLIAASRQVGLLDKSLYRYRQRQGSITHNASIADVKSELLNCAEQRAFLEKNFPQLLVAQSGYYAHEFLIDYRNCSQSSKLSPRERQHAHALIRHEMSQLASSSEGSWSKGMYLRYLLIRLRVLSPIQRLKFRLSK